MMAIVTVVLLSLLVLETFAGQAKEDVDTTAVINESATIPSVRRPPTSDFKDNGLLYSRFGKKPRKKDMDRDYMIEILGGGYDTDFLSEEEPEILTEISSPVQLDQGSPYSWVTEYLYKELELLNITGELLKFEEESMFDTKYLDAFKRWLLEKANCPVHFTWKDIGPLFWPRWMKRGSCSSSNSNCSWPSGMYCTPAETTTVQILRWQCSGPLYKGKRRHRETSGGTKARGGWRRGSSLERRKCQWIKVPYPITSACICRC